MQTHDVESSVGLRWLASLTSCSCNRGWVLKSVTRVHDRWTHTKLTLVVVALLGVILTL